MRIENRVFASGPTVVDEMANAAFWIGTMMGMGNRLDDITKKISYADIRDNFAKASRYGIDSKFTWFNDKKISAEDLILKELIPLAREGLKANKVATADIDKYLGIIKERAKGHTNGARWQLRAYTKLIEETTRDEALTCLTASIIKNQNEKDMPIHKWKMPELGDLTDYHPSDLTVEEFMETDLFTVQKDDIIELVAEMMDWRKIRYTPVEDTKGKLVGLVTSRLILRYFIRNAKLSSKANTVNDIMIKKPVTITADTTIVKAMEKMRKSNTGCLPVVKGKELIGIITEMDFLRISGRLIQRMDK